MIRHIVMWKFRPGTEAEQAAFLEGLRGLMGVVPQLRGCEVARNVGQGSDKDQVNREAKLTRDLQRKWIWMPRD